MAVLNQLDTVSVTLTSGGTLSAAVNINGLAVVGVIAASGWTTAAISFDASVDGSNYYPLYTDGGEVTIPSSHVGTDQARLFALDPAFWVGVNYLKVRSGTKGSEVGQGAERGLTLVVRPV